MFGNTDVTGLLHYPLPFQEVAVRQLPVQLPPMRPMRLERRGGPVREIVFFLIAFAAMFGAAMIAIDLFL